MKIHRLNVILKNLSNHKYKYGFIKYLSTLKFEDFEYLLHHYLTTILRLMLRYKNKKANFLSKQWFINKKINSKYRKIAKAFYDANFDYCIKIDEKIQKEGKQIIDLLNNIRENQTILENLEKVQIYLTDMKNDKEIVEFASLAISTIFVKQELGKLYEEIGKLNKQK